MSVRRRKKTMRLDAINREIRRLRMKREDLIRAGADPEELKMPPPEIQFNRKGRAYRKWPL